MKLKFVLYILIWFFGFKTGAQNITQKPPQKTRILFLLDASGSMLAQWGDQLRIQAAKSLLSDLVDSLRVNDHLELALRAYGHQFPRQQRNCKDTRLVVPFSPKNHDLILQRLNMIKPKGTTPLAFSLEQAATDFPLEKNVRNILIIITDGLESCDGDPCKVSIAMQKRGVFLKPMIIGLGMDESYLQNFACLGHFFEAKNLNDFSNSLHKALKQTLSKTTVSVELLDVDDRPLETDVNVTFVNAFTGQAVYEFVHFRDKLGRPDSVQIEPVLSYNVKVNTIPPVTKKSVELEGGKHNVITINSPQGKIQLLQKNTSEYERGVEAIIRKQNSLITLNIQKVPSEVKYLVGNYDLEFLTLPRKIYKNVAVTQSQTTTIDLPAPGLVNLNFKAKGYGSLFEMKKDGTQYWVFNIDATTKLSTYAIQPGNYKIVFRPEFAQGSKFSEVHEFSVTSGETVTVNLY